MKKPRLFQRNTNALALSLLLVASPQAGFAEDSAAPAPANPYSSTRTIVLEDGTSLNIVTVNSPPPSPQAKLAAKSLAVSAVPKNTPGDVKISDVPAFMWSYGSSATAGAMIAGYYDRGAYANMYTGPTDGGCMPLTNASWDKNITTNSHECPLSATKQGLDGRTTRGHVDDYYISRNATGPDPYVVNSWTEHTPGECTGDYMKTSIWFPGSKDAIGSTEDINRDGAATFIIRPTGKPINWESLYALGYDEFDAGYGLKLFFESRGYEVSDMYNQYIDAYRPYSTSPDLTNTGFTYNQYKAEINAGRPVMMNLSGLIVVGIGYNESKGKGIIFHDSESYDEHTMIWGGTHKEVYTHSAVTIVTLAKAINPSASCGKKFPWPMFLPAITGSK